MTEGRVKGKQRATPKEVKEVKEKTNGVSGKEKPDPRVKEFLNYWGEIFLQVIGQPYTFTYGKEGKIIKNLLQVHELSTLKDLTGQFFKDEQCRRRGLTIGIFFQEINRLISKAKDPLEEARREIARSRGEKDSGE